MIFLSFSSCKRGSFDRVKESSFQYLCKNYLLFCDQIVAKIDMFDCDPLHNLYERDGTHYIDREVLADNLVVEKEEKETDVFDPYSEKNLKKKKRKTPMQISGKIFESILANSFVLSIRNAEKNRPWQTAENPSKRFGLVIR